jgi:hypothetical protein
VLGDVVGGYGADRAGHPHSLREGDRGVGEEVTEALLDVLVLCLMALVMSERLEGALVSLVEEEELAVGEHLVDELVEQLGPGGDDLRFVELVEPVEDVAAEGVEAQVELEEDVFLALEVVVERGLRHFESIGDLPQRSLVVALLVEELERDVEDALPGQSPRAADGRALTGANPEAGSALAPFVAGHVHTSHDGRRLRAPLENGAGVATTIVRALDHAGIAVDDVQVHQPSLDDVFLALTGHGADSADDADEPDLPQAA